MRAADSEGYLRSPRPLKPARRGAGQAGPGWRRHPPGHATIDRDKICGPRGPGRACRFRPAGALA